MRYRLAGSLSLLACCLFGLGSRASAQEYSAGPTMAAYSPAWAMPPGSIPPGMMAGGSMAQQAYFQDSGEGYASMPAVDQAHPDGGYAPGGCTDGCDTCGGSSRAGLMRRGLLKGKCADGMCGCGPMGMGGGMFAGGGDGWGEGGGGLLGDCVGFRWLRFVLPEDDGGACAVRWFDVAVDFLYYQRDDVGGNRVFSRFGTGPAAPIALQTSQLDFEYEPAFRFLANIQLGSANSLEFGYFGAFNHATFAQATGAGTLTSVMSNFGTFPAGGFQETDFGNRHRLEYSSELSSFEVNYRTRWMAPECRYQGSWLMGVRYIHMDDDLLYQTVGQRSRMDFLTNTNNSLTGLQLGGDLWMCLLPGLRLGVEGKAGVYGNYSNAGASINTTLPFHYNEDSHNGDAAFVGELNLNMLYRMNYNWTVRMGYNFLWLEGIALATDNFNATPPNGFSSVAPRGQLRRPFVNNNSDVLFHGLNFGVEYMW